jgi:twitching motility protein PilT
MQTGQIKHGMQTLNQSLFNLFKKQIISRENALGRSTDREELVNMIQNTQVRII